MLHSLLDFWAYSWMFIGAIVAIWMAVAAPLKSYPLTTGALKFCAIRKKFGEDLTKICKICCLS